MKISVRFYCMLLCALIQSSGAANIYRGAVVEYHPVKGNDEEARVASNVANYVSFIKLAKAQVCQSADIIVFPENGLLTRNILSPIPDPSDSISPCNSTFVTTEVVKNLSCASQENAIYTVVNLLEKRACNADDKGCPPRGYFIFNTNVGFDRRGIVIARYSKFNLYDEGLTNKTEQPERAFFDTDFGVRFGMFTCFDILFPTPALQLIHDSNITDFVFTTHWYSELPFLTALQVQRGWAETNNVNLLASGVNYPSTATFGSGIYNGKRGELIQIMPEVPTSILLISNIPKIKGFGKSAKQEEKNASSFALPSNHVRTENEEVELLRDHMQLFQSEIIQPGKRFDGKVCSTENFCCHFQVSVTSLNPDSNNYTPRAIVFDGIRKFGASFRGGVQCCGVVLCKGPDIMNCSSRVKKIPELFEFTEIHLKGDFRLDDSFQFPTTLTDGEGLEPLTTHKYKFNKKRKGNSVEASLQLLFPVTNLQAFGIWGRDFTRDGKSGGSSVLANPAFVITFAFCLNLGML